MLNFLIGILLGPVVSYYVSKVVWRAYILWNARDPSSKFSHLPIPPGDFGLPLIGETLLWAIQGSRFNFKRREKYGKLFSTNFIGKTMVKVTGPEYVKKVLTAPHDTVTTVWPTTVRCLLGESSIANSVGSVHKYRRKVFLKAFTHAALNSYIPKIHQEVARRVHIWKHASNPPRVYGELKQMTFEVAFNVLVGLTFKDDDERQQLFETFDTMISNLFSLPYDLPGSGFRKGMKARGVIHEILDYHVKQKRRTVQEIMDSGNSVTDVADDSTANALHYILEAEMRDKLSENSPVESDSADDDDTVSSHQSEKATSEEEKDHVLSDVELKETTVEMLFAGYQTTASVATSTIISLIQHPDVFRKLEDELRQFGVLPEEKKPHQQETNGHCLTQSAQGIKCSSPTAPAFIDNTIPIFNESRNRDSLSRKEKNHEDNLNNGIRDRTPTAGKESYAAMDEEGEPSLTLETLSKLQYLEQIMKETLRVMPPILGGYRQAIKTFQLGNYRVPKGWTIIYNIRDTHESEWREDMEFRPERFSPESWKENRESRFRWIPFGAGPRVCVGKEFARLQFKLFIIELVRNFSKIEFANGKPPPMFAIPFLHPTDGLPVKLTPRDEGKKMK